MSDFGFVLKVFALTLLLVVLMQVRVGERTVEQHSLTWLHQSSIGKNLNGVAEGTVTAARKGYAFAASMIGPKSSSGGERSHSSTASKESSSYSWKIKRSDAYERRKAEELTKAAESEGAN